MIKQIEYVSNKTEYDHAVHLAEIVREAHQRRHTNPEQNMMRSRYFFRQAHRIMHNVLLQIRQGGEIDTDQLAQLTVGILKQLSESKDAFLTVCRTKKREEYISMRAISFCALLLMLAQARGFSQKAQMQIGIGALLHDAGKMWLPLQLLNTAEKYKPREWRNMQSHIKYSKMILLSAKYRIGLFATNIIGEHHERLDGTGYPNALKGDEISLIGRMAGIADVYDALTSNRPYREAISPTQALQHLIINPEKFDTELVHTFIRHMGIYPVGTLVKLSNHILGVVVEQNHSLLHPKIRLLYDTVQKTRLPEGTLDLSRDPTQTIISTVTERQAGLTSVRLLG